MASTFIIQSNLRLRELEQRISDQARASSEERLELERRHSEAESRLQQMLNEAKASSKRKQNELKQSAADLRRCRAMLERLSAELEATRAYANDLLSHHAPVDFGGSREGEATSAVAAALTRLREEREELAARLQAREEQFERERAMHLTVRRDQDEAHARAQATERELLHTTAVSARLEALLEAERVTNGQLRRELLELGNYSRIQVAFCYHRGVSLRFYDASLVETNINKFMLLKFNLN